MRQSTLQSQTKVAEDILELRTEHSISNFQRRKICQETFQDKIFKVYLKTKVGGSKKTSNS